MLAPSIAMHALGARKQGACHAGSRQLLGTQWHVLMGGVLRQGMRPHSFFPDSPPEETIILCYLNIMEPGVHTQMSMLWLCLPSVVGVLDAQRGPDCSSMSYKHVSVGARRVGSGMVVWARSHSRRVARQSCPEHVGGMPFPPTSAFRLAS